MSNDTTTGARQGRSPAYPYVSLRKALGRAKALYKAEGKHAVPPSSAYKAWGIGAKSSGARQTLAALKHFELVTYVGKGVERHVRVSNLALKVILDKRPDSPERDDLIRQAAMNPPIYAELWQKYGADLPSDATIETYLVLEREFNESAVPGLIADFKDTIELAKLSEPAKMPEDETDDTFNVGDHVNWESQGQVHWRKPWKVVEIATHEDGQRFLRVEGVDEDAGQSGWIPMNEAVHAKAVSESDEGPGRTFAPPPLTTGVRREVFALDEGDVVLSYPNDLSESSYSDLEGYLQLFLKKARRRAGVPEPKKSSKSDQ